MKYIITNSNDAAGGHRAAHLSLHDRKVDTIFHLLGKTADGMTKSFGWCLSQVPSFLDRLGGALGTHDLSAHNAFC